MRLYVLRHGLALTVTEAHVSQDSERPLADLGRDDVRAMARYLKDQKAEVAAILCSPLVRARQTAEEAAAILSPKSGVSVFEPLSNQISGPDLLEEVRVRGPQVPELMIIGHQPQLGELVAHMLGKALEIRPGGLVAVDLDKGGRARLLWNRNP